MSGIRLVARVAASLLCSAAAVFPAMAEMQPSLNLYGATGLIDMPSAETQQDGMLTTSITQFGPIHRTTLSFQVTERLSGSFRFLGVSDFNKRFCPPACDGLNQFETYYDRSFDLRYKLLDEGRYLPAVSIGLQDFVGTGVIAGEYIVATKSVTPNLKVTAGLGWGRLGSHNGIGSPFGVRPQLSAGNGGNFNTDQWFRGEAAPFGGVEWQINDKWTAKAEYSSDNYDDVARQRGTFEHKSPLNFGVEYQPNETFRLGAYHMYGSEIGVAAHIYLNPKKRPGGGVAVSAPDPIKPRPSRGADPEAWSTTWVGDAPSEQILRDRLAKRLLKDGVEVAAVRFEGNTAYVQVRNTINDAEAQVVGRTARALTVVAPASVERFVIIPQVNGMAVSQVVVARSDLEALEFDTQASEKMLARAQILPAPRGIDAGFVDLPESERLSWSLSPYSRVRLFDQKAPFKMGVGLELKGSYRLAPGLSVTGAINKLAIGNLDDRPPLPDRNGLHPVRSANYFYDRDGDPALEKLYMSYYTKLGSEIYGRATVGYLERMYGGISSELLYLPTNEKWAIGAELNYVAQRSPNGGLGFDLPLEMFVTDGCTNPSFATGRCVARDSYNVVTGHISGYYKFENDFHAQLDVGRYLAGDVGATLSLKREFNNGWRIGAFVTKTDVSADQFGSGSFDKGITLEIPMTALLGKASTESYNTTLRPFGRDGGQRIDVDGRLYETVRGYRADGLGEQWGRFWK